MTQGVLGRPLQQFLQFQQKSLCWRKNPGLQTIEKKNNNLHYSGYTMIVLTRKPPNICDRKSTKYNIISLDFFFIFGQYRIGVVVHPQLVSADRASTILYRSFLDKKNELDLGHSLICKIFKLNGPKIWFMYATRSLTVSWLKKILCAIFRARRVSFC